MTFVWIVASIYLAVAIGQASHNAPIFAEQKSIETSSIPRAGTSQEHIEQSAKVAAAFFKGAALRGTNHDNLNTIPYSDDVTQSFIANFYTGDSDFTYVITDLKMDTNTYSETSSGENSYNAAFRMMVQDKAVSGTQEYDHIRAVIIEIKCDLSDNTYIVYKLENDDVCTVKINSAFDSNNDNPNCYGSDSILDFTNY